MKPDYNALEQQLKRAVEHETPDVLQNVLRQIEMDETREAAVNVPTQLSPPQKKVWVKWVNSIAAVFILVAVVFSYQCLTPATIIDFDVNPSIQLNVNGFDKVIGATALNEDGYTVLDEMNLKNTDLNVAVNAIIGSMVKHGYINELNNSILVSIEGKDTSKSTELQQTLLTEISDTLSYYAVEGVVISQTISDGETLQQLASDYGISTGKAALIELLVAQDSSLTFEELSALSINDICLLITARYPHLEGIETAGEVSSIAYIGEDSARELVLSHAKLDEDEVLAYKTELDLRDDRVVYIIEFRSADAEYNYSVDATTGNIIEFVRDITLAEAAGDSEPATSEQPAENASAYATSESTPVPSKSSPMASDNAVAPSNAEPSSAPSINAVIPTQAAPSPSPEASVITETAAPTSPTVATAGGILSSDEVVSIAVSYAGISSSSISKNEVKLKQKSNSSYYEVEIKISDGSKYEFNIDAYTGAILEYKGEVKESGDSSSGSSDSNLISKEEAFSIAFTHAGVSDSELKKKDIELDDDHGVKIYEVEFTLKDGKKYQYKINASSGAIIEVESK